MTRSMRQFAFGLAATFGATISPNLWAAGGTVAPAAAAPTSIAPQASLTPQVGAAIGTGPTESGPAGAVGQFGAPYQSPQVGGIPGVPNNVPGGGYPNMSNSPGFNGGMSNTGGMVNSPNLNVPRFGNAPYGNTQYGNTQYGITQYGTPLGNPQFQTGGSSIVGPGGYSNGLPLNGNFGIGGNNTAGVNGAGSVVGGVQSGGVQHFQNGAVEIGGFERTGNGTGAYPTPTYFGTGIPNANGAMNNVAGNNAPGASAPGSIAPNSSAATEAAMNNAAMNNYGMNNAGLTPGLNNLGVNNSGLNNSGLNNSATNNPGLNNGAVNNGAVNNGAVNNGTMNNGAMNNPGLNNGSVLNNGANPAMNNAVQNNVVQNNVPGNTGGSYTFNPAPSGNGTYSPAPALSVEQSAVDSGHFQYGWW